MQRDVFCKGKYKGFFLQRETQRGSFFKKFIGNISQRRFSKILQRKIQRGFFTNGNTKGGFLQRDIQRDIFPKMQSFKNALLDGGLLYDDSRIKIRDDYVDENMTVSEFIDQLTNTTDSTSIFSEKIFGTVSKTEMKNKFTYFLKFYS